MLRFTTRVGLISAATAPIVVANPDFDLRRSDELEQDLSQTEFSEAGARIIAMAKTSYSKS